MAARYITIWHTWNEYDAADSDRFWTTEKEARQHINEQSDLDPGDWHIQPERIRMTKDDICHALTMLPMR